MVAVGLIMFLSVVNCVSLQWAGRVQNAATILKVAGLAVVIVAGLLFGTHAAFPPNPAPATPPAGGSLVAAVGIALIPALFSYNGWTYSSYVAGEIKEPERALPISILAGIGIVLLIYLAINVALLRVLTFEELQQTNRPAAVAMEAIFGLPGGRLTTLAVLVSTFGTVNAVLLSCTRTYYAMAREGLFFRKLQQVHPRYRTPAAAILVQGILASAFALSGGFERILSYFAVVDYIFFGLAIGAVVVLRWREPDLPRPYRAWGYPFTPLLFVATVAWYTVNTIIQRPAETAVGVVLTTAGIPFFLHWRRQQRLRAQSPADRGGVA
jgi:basic amino acid/polyamine antiporter, APA family